MGKKFKSGARNQKYKVFNVCFAHMIQRPIDLDATLCIEEGINLSKVESNCSMLNVSEAKV